MFTTLAPANRNEDQEGIRWAQRIERALGGHGIRAVFQPIIELTSRRVVGYEALTRFDDTFGQVTGPEQWFAAARQLGAGEDLDAICLSVALSHRVTLPEGCFLSVNVDPGALQSPQVRAILVNQRSLARVVIEITEHQSWTWPAIAPVVNEVRSIGATIAVDNTTSGYVGLRQLLDLRPSILKVDRGLVDGLANDEAKVAMIEMVALFARRLGAIVIAEGVENDDEAEALTELGVPLAQGFLFGRPAAPWGTVTP